MSLASSPGSPGPIAGPFQPMPAARLPVEDWRRLSPRMLLVHPITEGARAFPVLLGVLFAGTSAGWGSVPGLVVLVGIVGLAVVRWFTTRYRITPTQLELRRGLLRKRVLVASLDRVRTVDVTSHALHRVLGLAKVVIGTGVSDRKGKSELALDGLPAGDAGKLREQLLHRARLAPDAAPSSAAPADPAEDVLLVAPRSWVRFAPFTLSGAITALTVAAFGWRVINESGENPNRFGVLRPVIDHLRALSPWRLGAEVVLGLLIFVLAASVIGYLLAFWDFRLTRHAGGTLHVSRGLITKRATSIEERRLRGAELSEPLLLRGVRGGRLIAIATGLRVGRGAERGGTVLMPPGPIDSAVAVGAAVIGTAVPFTARLTGHGPRAARRRFTRALGVALSLGVVFGAVVQLISGSYGGWLLAPVLLAIAAGLAADRADSLGHTLAAGYLVSRFGSLVRRRSALATDGVIGWTWRSSPFQRRAGLVTLVATTAAGRQSYRIQDVPDEVALAVVTSVSQELIAPFAS